MPNQDVVLHLSLRQAKAIERAAIALAKLGIGKIEELAELHEEGLIQGPNAGSQVAAEAMRDYSAMMKIALGHPQNGSYGIRNPKAPNAARHCFEAYSIIKDGIRNAEHATPPAKAG